MRSRRAFLAGGGAALGALAAGWGSLIEPEFLQLREIIVPILPPGASPIRAAHLSDFHAWDATPLALIEEAVRMAASAEPDLILVTGDFITRRLEDKNAYGAVLAGLSAAAPVFAVLGNHDGGSWAAKAGGFRTAARIRSLLERAKIAVLDNEHAKIFLRGTALHLVGTGDLWSDECIPETPFSNFTALLDEPAIVLSHNPDSKELLRPFDWDLLLSGHTHGGQFVVPFLGLAPFAPVSDKRFLRGLHRWEERYIHVSAGVGNLHGVRFNCPPEVTILRLVSPSPAPDPL
jgi:predicted MPP superfamily phosphohydrolase